MKRLIAAFKNSMRALVFMAQHEKAVRQELLVFLISIPVAMLIASSISQFFWLIGILIFVIIVETINTAIEATCNAVSREFKEEIRLAKDAGSLAVLLSILLAICVWLSAIISLFWAL